MTTNEKLAIIDLGTNTFHLLLVESSKCKIGFEVLYRERHYVLLAEGGIDTISDSSMQRAKSAIDAFQNVLSNYKDIELVIVGTEALRVATNGNLINIYIKEHLSSVLHIISGNREAELIFKGNKLIVSADHTPYLIMDIGGGSTEFILVDDNHIILSNSYPLGVTKIYNAFNDTDPISIKAISSIESHIENQLSDMTEVIKGYNLNCLIGASGSFEVLSEVLTGNIPQQELVNISLADFEKLSMKVISSSIDERRDIKGIPENRIKFIQVAFIMMRKIIDMYAPDQIGVSPFAIKEGLISEWLTK
jgi:exopolyphosphatase/guanosine-5'-triphosphate,3'-diphosphate pyrophosphatase